MFHPPTSHVPVWIISAGHCFLIHQTATVTAYACPWKELFITHHPKLGVNGHTVQTSDLPQGNPRWFQIPTILHALFVQINCTYCTQEQLMDTWLSAIYCLLKSPSTKLWHKQYHVSRVLRDDHEPPSLKPNKGLVHWISLKHSIHNLTLLPAT